MTHKVTDDIHFRAKIVYREDLDGLRAVAVLGVVFFHLGLWKLPGGYAGVDVFFVISGFLITGAIAPELTAKTFSLWPFLTRRIHRLLPSLLVTLLICLIVATFVLPPDKMISFGKSLAASAVPLSNFYFWTESSYFDSSAEFKPLLHTWSLSLEEQFYLFWPLLLGFIVQKRKTPSVLVHLVFVVGVSFTLAMIVLKIDPTAGYFLMPTRAFEFMIGAVVYFLGRPQKVTRPLSELLSLLGLYMILYAFVHFDQNTPFPSQFTLLPCTGAAILIGFGQQKSFVHKFLSLPPMTWIGQLSYPLYLAHWPVFVFGSFLFEGHLSPPIRIVFFLLSLILAVLIHNGIEQPLRRPQSQSWSKRQLSGLFSMSFVLGAAGLSLKENGWLWRSTPPAALKEQLLAKGSDRSNFYGAVGCTRPRCEIQQKAAKKIIVIGDSHAQAYFSGFKAFFPHTNFVFFEAGSCGFFSPEFTTFFDDPILTRECREARELAFEEISRGAEGVILAQNWGGSRFVREKTRQRVEFSKDLRPWEFYKVEITKLEKLVSPAKLLIFANVPTTKKFFSPLDCLTTPFGTRNDCGHTNLEEVQDRREFATDFKKNLSHSIRILDPYESLCEAGKCKNIDSDFPLYSDDNHLSIWGSELVIRHFSNEIHDFFEI